MREILPTCEKLLAEAYLGLQDWKSIIIVIQAVLNSVLLKRLGKKAESTVHTLLKVMTGTMATLRTLTSKFLRKI